jgi:hypothetical protein
LAFRRHEAARILLDRGAGLANVNNTGMGLLHLLAIAGDVEMMHIFRSGSLQGLERDGKDKTGKTPRQLFRERPNIEDMTPQSLGLRAAFNQLMALVGRDAPRGMAAGGLNDEKLEGIHSEEDEFFDANEGCTDD